MEATHEFEEVTEEVLPEIQIREHISINDIINENPNFVALDDEYIEAYLEDLVDDKSRGKAFLELHKRVLSRSTKSLIPYANIKVKARRSEIDPENEVNYAELVKEDYHIVQDELFRLANIFEITDAAEVGQPVLILDETVKSKDVVLETGDTAAVLYEDFQYQTNFQMPVSAIAWKPKTWTSENYVFDAIVSPTTTATAATSGPTPSATATATRRDLLETRLQKIMPKMKDLVNNITDLHTLKVILAMNGIEFENITENQLKFLRNLTIADDASATASASASSIPEILPRKSAYSFKTSFTNYVKIIENHLKRIEEYLTDSRYASLQAAYDAYISDPGSSQYNVLEGFPTPYELLRDIVSGSMPLHDARQVLNNLRISLTTTDVKSFFNYVINYNKERAERLTQTLNLIKDTDDEEKAAALFTFAVSNTDIHEIRQGNDQSMYEGLSMAEPEFIDAVGDAEVDNPDTLDIEENDFVASYSENGAGNSNFMINNRAPDYIPFAYNRIKELVEKSGLPWDFNTWIAEAFSMYAFPASRLHQLKSIAENTSDTILQDIAEAETKEAGLRIAANISNREEAKRIQDEYPQIYQSWLKTCEEVFLDGIVYWALDILEQSISGSLDMRSFKDGDNEAWGPVGPPLEQGKSGVFVYIGKLANLKLDDLKKYAEDKYSVKLNHINRIWVSMGRKYHRSVQAVHDAFLNAIADAAKKKSVGARVTPEFFLATYIPEYLNLPNITAQEILNNKQAWAKGCCLAKLNNNYKGDIDFRFENGVKESAVYKIKEYLGKVRWLAMKRPNMFVAMKPEAAKDQQAQSQLPQVVAAKLPLEIPASEFSNLDGTDALADIARGHINETAVLDKIETCDINQASKTLLKTIVQSRYDASLYINMANHLGLISKNTEYKSRLNPDLPALVIKYLMVAMLSQIPDRTSRIDAVKRISKMKDTYIIPSMEEVQIYINKKREEIKQIKIRAIEELEDKEEQQAMLAASRLGLTKYVDVVAELRKLATDTEYEFSPDGAHPENADAADAAAEADFVQRSTDADNGNDEYYDF
jgi:hypothetical protein